MCTQIFIKEIHNSQEMETSFPTSFPGCPLVLTPVRDTGSIPGWGTKIPHAMQHSQKINNEKILNKQKKRTTLNPVYFIQCPHSSS
jgi:hypothetical protein